MADLTPATVAAHFVETPCVNNTSLNTFLKILIRKNFSGPSLCHLQHPLIKATDSLLTVAVRFFPVKAARADLILRTYNLNTPTILQTPNDLRHMNHKFFTVPFSFKMSNTQAMMWPKSNQFHVDHLIKRPTLFSRRIANAILSTSQITYGNTHQESAVIRPTAALVLA